MSELGQSLRKIREREIYSNKALVIPKKPIGIKTPLEKGNVQNGESLFKMHFSIEDQVVDNLKNLIMTQKGERLGFTDYGTNINRIYSDTSLNEDEIADVVSQEISTAVSKYMPSIRLSQFYTQKVENFTNKLNSSNTAGLALSDALDGNIEISSVSSQEINKNNKDIDSIHKIMIEFFIPSLDNQKRLITLFVNSGK
jgi:phage baseplate assembly protein W